MTRIFLCLHHAPLTLIKVQVSSHMTSQRAPSEGSGQQPFSDASMNEPITHPVRLYAMSYVASPKDRTLLHGGFVAPQPGGDPATLFKGPHNESHYTSSTFGHTYV